MRHRLTYLLSLSTALVGCGDDGVKHLADAPPSGHDAAIDAPPDAPPGPVAITVVSAGMPQKNVKVYFQGPDSTEILSTMTDDTGTASALMPNGGFVTALNPFPVVVLPSLVADGDVLRTFANVKPGDHLVLNDNTIAPTYHPLTVALPLDAATPLRYDVYTDCGLVHQGSYAWGELTLGNGSGSGTAKVNPIHARNLLAPSSPGNVTMATLGCDITGKANFVVITSDVDGNPLNVAVASAVTLDSELIDLSAATFAEVKTYDFNFTNGAAFLDGIGLDLNFLGAGGELSTAYDSTYGGTDLTAGAGTATVGIPVIANTMPVARLYPDVAQTSYGEMESYQWGLTPVGTAIAMDLTNRALLDYKTAPAFDQPTHAVSWTTNAGAAPNAYFVESSFQRGDGDATPFIDWDWQMVGAFSAATLAYPVLPGDAADYNATDSDSVDVDAVIVAAIPIGYDAVKPHAYDVIRLGADLTPLAAGTSGHFETDTFSFENDKIARAKTPNQVIRAMAKATQPAALMHQMAHKRRAHR